MGSAAGRVCAARADLANQKGHNRPLTKEEAMNDRRPRLSRRHFLFALGVGGAATAATVATRGSTMEQPLDAGAADGRRARGYRESAHIARYYRSTKI
jgi:hypothetical protein